MKIEKRLQEIKAEKLEIRRKLEANEEMELDAVEKRLADLEEEEKSLVNKREMAQRINVGAEDVTEIKKEEIKELCTPLFWVFAASVAVIVILASVFLQLLPAQ